jgi:hypothetical protein
LTPGHAVLPVTSAPRLRKNSRAIRAYRIPVQRRSSRSNIGARRRSTASIKRGILKPGRDQPKGSGDERVKAKP